ncbi:MAG: hypothetical protein L3J98_02900 [Gammaproteobacteria bacterium]|nr:hypothetical protein [Gammaproteobacteria bacterium]
MKYYQLIVINKCQPKKSNETKLIGLNQWGAGSVDLNNVEKLTARETVKKTRGGDLKSENYQRV